MKQLLLIAILLVCSIAFGQTESQIRTIDSLEASTALDSLKTALSYKKKINPLFELAAYTALSYYPELDSTRITFKSAKIKTTLNARPSVGSLLFRSKKKRKYVIRINKQVLDSVIQFNDVPFNAKVGLIGHEFAHLADYQKRGFFKVIGRMFDYAKESSKATFEKEIDGITIEHGLGWQLYDWSDYVLNKSNASVSYKAFKRKIYLTPSDIENKINNK
jgi:hypothetical protein